MVGAKTKEHRIRNDSENQFEELINHLDWEADSPTHDYGLDYWVEVFNLGNPSGDVFRVQLKGTDNSASYTLKTSALLFYDVSVKHLKDWYSNILPIYFILWDTENRQGYWVYIQDHIEEKLQDDNNWLNTGNKKRIHIPIENRIRIDEVDSFVVHLTGKCLAIRDGKRGIQAIEKIRGVSWNDTRKQFMQLETAEKLQIAHTQTIATLDLHLKLQPDDADKWTEKAWLHYQQCQFEEALQAINRAKGTGASTTAYFLHRGCILCEYANSHGNLPRQFYFEAIECFEQGKQTITSASFHYNIGNCYSGLGNPQQAIEHYDLALDALPDQPLAAQIWKNRGTCFFHLGDHLEEKRSYHKALELVPSLWEAYFSLATTLVHFQEFAEAEQIILEGIPYVPNFPNAVATTQYLLAYTKWKLSKDEEALPLVNTVLDVQPNSQNACWLKAHLLMGLWRQNDVYIEEAQHFFGMWILTDPTNVLAKGELHLILKAQGKSEQARNVLKEALAATQDAPATMLYDYAMLLKEENNIEGAIDYLKRAAVVDRNHAIEHQLGHLYFRKGDYLSALDWYQKALKSSDDPIHTLGDVATCLELLGKHQEFALIMMEYLLFIPDNVRAWRNLAIALDRVGLGHLYDEMAPAVERVRIPLDLSLIFDELVERMFPGRRHQWLQFRKD